MANCPYCGADIIQGLDECETCGQTLTDLSLPVPGSVVEKHLLSDRIEKLNPPQPSTVSAETPVGDALKKMVAERIGCLIVADGDQLLGIFTERDAVMKLNTDAARLAAKPISEFMTPKPITLAAQDKIVYALHKMDVGGYRHIPILADKKLRGVISIRDILGYLTDRIAR